MTTLTLTAAEPEAFLPKLGAVKVDGDLTECNAAVTVLFTSPQYMMRWTLIETVAKCAITDGVK